MNPTLASLTIRRSSRRRTVALQVTRGAVVLHAPLGVPEQVLLDFVEQKRGWIERALRRSEERTPPGYRLEPGEELPCLGETLTLRVGGRVARVGSVLEVPDVPFAERRTLVEGWYRREALAFFTALSAEMAARLGVTPGKVRLSEARTRWGSCAASGDLRFNWRVLLGPRQGAVYLCAHEVAHLRELNHSPRFWAVVGQLMPDYREARARLRAEGFRYTLDHGNQF